MTTYCVPVDTIVVNLQSPDSVLYWCRMLNCTEPRLRTAVITVGPLPADVLTYLRR